MADQKYCWSRSTSIILIREYKRNTFLYDRKHPDYRNRYKRFQAYKRIANVVNSTVPGCEEKDIKKKINSLRTLYFSEKAKIERSKKSNKVYQPSSYLWPMLKFLDDPKSCDILEADTRDACSLTENPKNIQHENFIHIDTDIPSLCTADISDKRFYNRKKDSLLPSARCSLQTSNSSDNNVASASKKRKSLDSLLWEAPETVNKKSRLTSNKVLSEDDSFDVFGKFIASELRTISQASSDIFARKVKRKMEEVLWDAWDVVDNNKDQHDIPNSNEVFFTSIPTTRDNKINQPFIIEEEIEDY